MVFDRNLNYEIHKKKGQVCISDEGAFYRHRGFSDCNPTCKRCGRNMR